jgi:hypothetical protein
VSGLRLISRLTCSIHRVDNSEQHLQHSYRHLESPFMSPCDKDRAADHAWILAAGEFLKMEFMQTYFVIDRIW